MNSHSDTIGQNGAECTNIPRDVTETSVPRPAKKARNRSRISNGQEILPGVDQRLAIARRYRDLVAQIAIDQGGPDRCSETRMRSFAGLPAGLCWPKRSRRGSRAGRTSTFLNTRC